MSIYSGNTAINKLYLGSTQLSKLFQGQLQLWPTSLGNYPDAQLSPSGYSPYNPPALVNYGTGFAGSDPYMAIKASDGSMFVGGNFTSYNGTTANRIVKIKPDGTLDTTFNTGVGFDANVRGISIGKYTGYLHVAGAFNTYQGVNARKMITLNATTGARITTYSWASTGGFFYGMEEVSATQVLAYGPVSSFGGIKRYLISNGAVDATFTSGLSSYTNGVITSLSVFDNGKILCGGTVPTNPVGFPTIGMWMHNADGSLDSTSNTNISTTSGITQGSINNMFKYNNIVYGAGSINGGFNYDTARAVKVNQNGTCDQTFKNNIKNKLTNSVMTYGINVQNDIVSFVGPFSFANETSGYIQGDTLFTDLNGNLLSDLRPIEASGFPAGITRGASGQTTFVQGISDTINYAPITSKGIYTYNPVIGATASIMVPAMNFQDGIVGTVYAIETWGDKLVIAGDIQSYNGITITSNMIRLNPDSTLDYTFKPTNVSQPIKKLLYVEETNSLMAGGLFGLRVYNNDGSLNSNWNANTFDGEVRSFYLNKYLGQVVVVGAFTKGIRKFTVRGVEDTVFYSTLGTGFDGRVNDVVWLQRYQRMYCVGIFKSLNGNALNGYGVVNADGSAYMDIVTGGFADGEPLWMKPHQNGNGFFVGGEFVSINEKFTNNFGLMMLNGDSDWYPGDPIMAAFTRPGAFNGPTYGMLYVNYRNSVSTYNSKYFVYGSFTSYIVGEEGYGMTAVAANNIGLIGGGYYDIPTEYPTPLGSNTPIYAGKAQTTMLDVNPTDTGHNLFLGGAFTAFGSSTAKGIVQVGVTGNIL